MNKETALSNAIKVCENKNASIQNYFSTHTFESMAQSSQFKKLISDLIEIYSRYHELTVRQFTDSYKRYTLFAEVLFCPVQERSKISFSDYDLLPLFDQEIDFMIFAKGLYALLPDIRGDDHGQRFIFCHIRPAGRKRRHRHNS